MKTEAAVEEVRCHENSLLWAFCLVFFFSDEIMGFLIYVPHPRALPHGSCVLSVCFSPPLVLVQQQRCTGSQLVGVVSN